MLDFAITSLLALLGMVLYLYLVTSDGASGVWSEIGKAFLDGSLDKNATQKKTVSRHQEPERVEMRGDGGQESSRSVVLGAMETVLPGVTSDVTSDRHPDTMVRLGSLICCKIIKIMAGGDFVTFHFHCLEQKSLGVAFVGLCFLDPHSLCPWELAKALSELLELLLGASSLSDLEYVETHRGLHFPTVTMSLICTSLKWGTGAQTCSCGISFGCNEDSPGE
ncbi:hypothetical protein ACRRTK_000006 [Alexandromys fortis]